MAEVPVHVAKGLRPEQITAYRLADNKTAELSDWDYELLAMELTGLQEMDYDLELLGFSKDELVEIMAPDATDGLAFIVKAHKGAWTFRALQQTAFQTRCFRFRECQSSAITFWRYCRKRQPIGIVLKV